MSRYRGPRFKITRRLGQPLPGFVQKSNTNGKENQPPGQHGTLRRKPSQYAIRLQEKQKLRYEYGISECQLISYVKQARQMKGSTGEIIMHLLENRLDTRLFRLGYAPTIRAARQLISHGHICINGQKLNIASYQYKTDDKISTVNPLIFKPLSTSSLINSQDDIARNILLVVEYYSRK
jgi:small subunit ribosomal protein S4